MYFPAFVSDLGAMIFTFEVNHILFPEN